MTDHLQTTEPIIAPLGDTTAEATAFRTLNETWIRELFALEATDIVMLENPRGQILAAGGAVLLARLGDEFVGSVALLAAGPQRFELVKMAVAPEHRGRGIGRALVLAAIREARDRGGRSIFLATNTRLAPALALYRSIGFLDIPASRPDLAGYPYARADAFLELMLEDPVSASAVPAQAPRRSPWRFGARDRPRSAPR